MLIEYLTAESGLGDDQVPASQISRLIIAGDSFGPVNIPGRGDGTPQVEDRKAVSVQDNRVTTN